MNVLDRSNATLVYLVAVLLLGGASAAGLTANVILQLGGCGLLAWSLLSAPRDGDASHPVFFATAVVVLIAVQFLPLPPGVWRHLPGRESVYGGFALLYVAPPWLTVSLAPWDSLSSLLWWLPALAIYFSLRRVGAPSSSSVVYVITAVAVISIAIEVLQRGTGQAYFYEITNYGQGTGFFANSNHQGSFLLATLSLFTGSLASKQEFNRQRIVWYRRCSLLELAILLLLLTGVLISGSLACAGLLVLVLAALGLIGFPNIRVPGVAVAAILVATVAGLITFLVWAPLSNDLTGAGAVAGMSRHDFLAKGMLMLRDFNVIGSGIGTFPNIYPWYEQDNQVGTTFANHAHDDLLEVLIETGIFGLAVISTFVGWYLRQSLPLWRAPRERSIQLGAAVAIGAVLLHSLVDYPLRTAAMSSIFALACALLTRISHQSDSPVPFTGRTRRHTKKARDSDFSPE